MNIEIPSEVYCPNGHGTMFRLTEEPTISNPEGWSQPTWGCPDCGMKSIFGVSGNQISVIVES